MTPRLPRSTRAAAVLAGPLLALAFPSAQGSLPPQPKFTVPAGFEVVRVAGPPLVDRPIVADFDEQGRLYVADASGTNDKVEKQLADRPHRIVRLEDKDGDGVFDTSVVFADRMMLPQGAMWFDGSLYVGAPPSIWKLTDTNDDGVADQREEWFAGKTLTGVRQRSPRPVSRARRVDLLDQGRVCRADVRAAGQASAGDTRCAHLPPAAGRDRWSSR